MADDRKSGAVDNKSIAAYKRSIAVGKNIYSCL